MINRDRVKNFHSPVAEVRANRSATGNLDLSSEGERASRNWYIRIDPVLIYGKRATVKLGSLTRWGLLQEALKIEWANFHSNR